MKTSLCVCLLLFAGIRGSSGQSLPNAVTPDNATGIQPYNTYAGVSENIALATGNLTRSIPLLHLPGRAGLDLDLALHYDSKLWTLHAQWNQYANEYIWDWNYESSGFPSVGRLQNLGYLWTLNIPTLVATSVPPPSAQAGESCFSGFIVTTSDGSKHAFANRTFCTLNGTPINDANRIDVADADDASFMRLDTSNINDVVAYAKNGEQMHFYSPFACCSPVSKVPDRITDTNGNSIYFAQTSSNTFVITDTVGRQVTFQWDPSTLLLSSISYYDSNGSPQAITFGYGSASSIAPTFANPVVNGGQKPYVAGTPSGILTSLTKPDGTQQGLKYSFAYNNFGELTKITYPAGGYTRYEYGLFTHQWLSPGIQNGPYIADFREVIAKHECRDSGGACTASTEDTTTYTPTVDGTLTSNSYSDVRKPSTSNPGTTDRTRFQFQTGSSLQVPYSSRELMRWIYSGESTLLRTVQTDYTDMPTKSWSLPIRVTTTLNDSGQSSKQEWDYDTFSSNDDGDGEDPKVPTTRYIDNPVQTREYDYGGTSPLRSTTNTWLKTGANNFDYFYGLHIRDRKQTENVYAGTVTGTPAAQTQYEYDSYTEGIAQTGAAQHEPFANTGYTTRGNVTASLSWRNTDGAWLTTRRQYDDAGNVRKIVDPGTHPTTFSYADSWAQSSCAAGTAAAYLTSTTNALGQTTSSKYNSCSGTTASVTDANSQTKLYSYDAAGRLLSTTLPDGGGTTYTYNDVPPFSVSSSEKMNASQNITNLSVLDGLGRTIQTQLTSDPEGMDYTDTTYDALGQIASVSNPYRSTSDPTYGITSYGYDALGRISRLTKQDGNAITTSYLGNCTTVTDETLRSRESCSDALGRVTQVIEPNPSTGSLTSGSYPTYYSYDALGNLTNVNQVGDGSAPARQRTFTYDSLSRLLTAYNPESGTVCYGTWSGSNCVNGYDADGNLINKTDARGVTTTYSYDSLHRVLLKRYSDGTFASDYTYDLATYVSGGNSIPTGSSVDRLIHISNDFNAATTFSYDAMGRVVHQSSCIPSNCNDAANAVSASYDLAGNLTSLTYPSGRTLGRSYSAAGRLTGVNFASFNGTPVNYQYLDATPRSGTISAYWPDGEPHLWGLGNGVPNAQDFNSRLQPQDILVGTPSGFNLNSLNRWSSKYYNWPDANGHNNGNIQSLTDQLNGTHSQSFSYDMLNRMTAAQSAAISGNAAWQQTFNPDAWGNLLQSGSYSFSAAYDGNNRLYNWSYDAAGNLLNDSFHQYAYDAEGRVKSVDMNGATYTYGADGERVRKDAGGTATEYIYFNGQPIAEHNPATGDWSDYIFANGKRIARADTFDRAIAIHGTNCSNCGWQYTIYSLGPGSLSGYVVQNGDKLYVSQYQWLGTEGGLQLQFLNSPFSTNWVAKDQDGNYANEDTVQSYPHFRTIDLSQFAGNQVTDVLVGADGGTQAGDWALSFEQMVLVSADGTVHPIYTGQSAMSASLYEATSGVTNEAFETQTYQNRAASSPLNTTIYYHEDHLGSSQLITTGYGWPIWQGTFLPFGQEWNPQLTTNHYKFTGYERDAESGTDYARARQYEFTQGRMMSPDPAGLKAVDLLDPQSWNMYAYVKNNPLRYTDPTGMYEEDVHRDLTAVLAYASGFDAKTAVAIGNSDQYIDDNPATSPDSIGHMNTSEESTRVRALWHFTTSDRRDQLWNDFEKSASTDALGTYLHAEQDSYSHAGYGAKYGHASAPQYGHAPDYTATDPAKADRMAKDTFDRLAQAAVIMNKAASKPVSWDAISGAVDKFNRAKPHSREKTEALGELVQLIAEIRAGKSSDNISQCKNQDVGAQCGQQ